MVWLKRNSLRRTPDDSDLGQRQSNSHRRQGGHGTFVAWHSYGTPTGRETLDLGLPGAGLEGRLEPKAGIQSYAIAPAMGVVEQGQT